MKFKNQKAKRKSLGDLRGRRGSIDKLDELVTN